MHCIMNFPNFEIELNLLKQGHTLIAGVDEAGRGPWAGPIVASAVVFKGSDPSFSLINDSKKLSPKKRAELDIIIKETAVSVGIGVVEVDIVDKIGIGKANKLAFLSAILNLNITPTFILTDYLKLSTSDLSLLNLLKLPNKLNFSPLIKNQQNIVKGDCVSISIAAASIVAKVYRDDIMDKLHLTYPQYGFNKHKGYGTKAHREALETYGPCAIHRQSFSPIKRLKENR
ncbi:MAG: ribonuclease HII [Patescibacteria group bacterium]